MAAIQGLHLGATADRLGRYFPTAIACQLRDAVKAPIKWHLDGGWHVEANAGGSYICARNEREMGLDDAHEDGVTALSRALDLSSVQSNVHSTMLVPGDDFTAVYRDAGRQNLVVATTIDHPMAVSIDIVIQKPDGSVERPAPPPDPVWNRAFRYYRLSQLASDPYEAYRNLYLAFETQMEQLFPRTSKEREGDWIRRCFTVLNSQMGLAQHAPDGHKAPNEYLYGTLYESIRCNLFHSRSAKAILPFYETDSSRLLSAYETLLNIWRRVAGAHLGIANGASIITYQGFSHMKAGMYGGVLEMRLSADDSQPKAADTTVSPRGEEEFSMEVVRYVGEVRPGVIRIDAHDSQPSRMPTINRLGLIAHNGLVTIGLLDGLDLSGIDDFYVRFSERLVQGSQPKMRFG